MTTRPYNALSQSLVPTADRRDAADAGAYGFSTCISYAVGAARDSKHVHQEFADVLAVDKNKMHA